MSSQRSARGRQAVAMSEEEVSDFLGANIKLQVATIGKEGSARST